MEEVPPFFMDDDVNLFNFQPDEDNFNISELLWSPSEEVPVNQSSMLQNPGPDSSLQSQNMQQMEGVPPSFMEDDVNQSELLLSPPEEVPVNQSSMLGNDQAGQNILMGNDVDSIQQTTQFPTPFPDQTMITMGGLDGASSSWITQNGPNWPQTPSSDQQWTNQLAMSNQVPGMLPQPPMSQCSRQFPQTSAMLPEPSQTLRSPQFPPHNLQVSGDHNQGQVDQASMIPHIDNMQQESLVPLNFGRSTRSQMENLQVHVLQNQNARPNASSAGPHSSLQSQNRGLNTQQVCQQASRSGFFQSLQAPPSLHLSIPDVAPQKIFVVMRHRGYSSP